MTGCHNHCCPVKFTSPLKTTGIYVFEPLSFFGALLFADAYNLSQMALKPHLRRMEFLGDAIFYKNDTPSGLMPIRLSQIIFNSVNMLQFHPTSDTGHPTSSLNLNYKFPRTLLIRKSQDHKITKSFDLLLK